MKKIIIISLFMSTLAIISCNDSINPYGEFTEDFILNGIMRGDSSYQVVTLSHSYQPEGFDPLTYKDDPAVAGTRIEIYYDNKTYLLRDSSTVRQDSSHFISPFKFYYTKNLKPDIDKEIRIRALLPNGLVLYSSTKTPNVYRYGFFDIRNDYYFPPDTGSFSLVRWDDIGKYVYQSDLTINYYLKGDNTLHRIAVPLLYNEFNLPVYTITKKDNFISFNISAVSNTLNELTKIDPNKSDFTIVNLTLNLLVLDEYLSAYYSAIQLGEDGFTIRIDDPDFSNIKGGLGIFGSYTRTQYTLRFRSEYLKSLGF